MAGQTERSTKSERRVRAKWLGGTKSEIRARNLPPIISDEPASQGDTDSGPTPRELALGSLAGCVVVIAHRLAHEMSIPFSGMEVEVRGRADRRAMAPGSGLSPNFEWAKVTVDITTDAPEEEVRALQEAHRRRCPITALFRESGMEFEDEWRIVQPKG